jgi:hypothetical protein
MDVHEAHHHEAHGGIANWCHIHGIDVQGFIWGSIEIEEGNYGKSE